MRAQRGFTLIEALLGLVVVVAIIAIFASAFSALGLRATTSHEVIAADLARQEVESLRRLNPNRLTNRVDSPFIGVLYNLGKPVVIADGSALHSPPNVLDLRAGSGTTASVRAVIPTNELTDASWSGKVFIRAQPDSSPGWQIGFTIRQADDEDGYRVRLAASTTDLDTSSNGTQNALLEKIVAGATTKLASALVTFGTGSWSTISLNATGTTIAFSLNGNAIFSVTDGALCTLCKGSLAIEGASGVHAVIDDVDVTTTGERWNFNAEPTGQLPGDWTNTTLQSLPGATGLLTITDVPGLASLKQIDVRVQWTESNQTRKTRLITLMRGS